MKSLRRYGIAAALLLCSSGLAWTAGTGTPLRISDNLVLTGAQENLIWQRLGRRAPWQPRRPDSNRRSMGWCRRRSLSFPCLQS
jgi:hypothetical protein